MNIRLLICLTVVLLGGCSSAKDVSRAQSVVYDPTTSARIRLFGNNGLPVAIKPGQDCASTEEPVLAYGYTVADKLNSTLGRHTNQSIGMPASWRSDHPNYGESYSEFVIPAGKPSVILMKMEAGEVFCLPSARVLVPQAGQDYEAYLTRKDGMCSGTVRLLSALESPGTAADVPVGICVQK
ncbi:hypothetical protein NUH87_20655 [Pseudomonas batumici]|uniref:hypothetical protein n=1 Tax=Pseudomonas batumici TaxID=226910 RepID=UPI0030CCF765